MRIAGFPRPLPDWTLPGKQPKPPATPPAADRAKGKQRGKGPDQPSVLALGAAINRAAPAGAGGPSQALVVAGSAAAATLAPGQRVKRKYTRRVGATVALKGGVAKPEPAGRIVHAALLDAGQAQPATQPAAAQAPGSSSKDSGDGSAAQPACDSVPVVPVQVGDSFLQLFEMHTG